MNSMRDPLDVLRSLDPAPDQVDPHGPRARADLARILASDPAAGPRELTRPARAPRLVAAAVAVLAVGSGLALLPSLTGSDPAYATWTAVPTTVPGNQQSEMADACRDAQREGAGSTHRQELASATTAIAERRGAWSLVLLTGDDGFSALCITDESRPLFRSSFGYVGAATDTAEGTDGSLAANALGVGSIDGRELSVATGPVGPDVVAVTYLSDEHGEVAATVSHGYFAFWLPGDELSDASRTGTPVEVTYRDGSTETVTVALG